MCFNITGCGNVRTKDLMRNITPQKVPTISDFSVGNAAMTGFAVRLFKECNPSKQNTLISPVSVMYALAMTANGADGETLSQMEDVLGMHTENLNQYLYGYKNSLSQGEGYKLNLANSIWFDDSAEFNANQDFLQINANYYGADIYAADFSKKSTLNDMNNWVNKKTDGIIPSFVERIEEDDVMFLINTLMFHAYWSTEYTDSNIKAGTFTCEDGKEQNVKFMHSRESVYLEDEMTVGFVKSYELGYRFVAFLPKEGTTISEYVDLLTAQKVSSLLSNTQRATVNATIPKFECEYDITLNETLKQMGMTLAFDEDRANLNKIGSAYGARLYIGEVAHKTFISVDERGTKAGAATKVKIKKKALVIGEEIKTVNLDRPFVYMIVDSTNNVPLFIGTVMNVNN